MKPAILAIDQGTTSTKALVFDREARCLFSTACEVPLSYPQPGWVEQDPDDLLRSVVEVARRALDETSVHVLALGLANQGETVVMWHRKTGRPLYNAINWQDRRTAPFCERLSSCDQGKLIRERTRLPIDPYFSATKLCWLLDNVEGARDLAERGELLAGTTDAWLLWNLTGAHCTDHTTASRTMLYNPLMQDWDSEVLELLKIPRSILPAIQSSDSSVGKTRATLLGREIPVTGMLVDQQAALFGQACYAPGEVKVTYGTGAFILLNTGDQLPTSHFGLLPTVAWSLGERMTYALDGGIYVAGAAIQWLRDGLGIIQSAEETEELALSVADSADVFFVPALAGMAAPYWDSDARGTILGLTRGTTRAHIVRAALEGIAFRTRDVLEAMVQDIGRPIQSIKADGSAAANGFLMQTLANVSNCEVHVAALHHTTALGIGLVTGLAINLWSGTAELTQLVQHDKVYIPHHTDEMDRQYRRWLLAVERARGWAKPTP